MKKLISFIIYSEKGFLKKPDINDGIYLTYNMLHKPALLGILGAIIGLDGYKKNQELPKYYKELKHIPIGVAPIGSEKGVFSKILIEYSNTTGLASNENGGNLIINEQTLINPAYKIFLLLDLDKPNEKKIYDYIREQKAEYLPYLGKNDYSLWWYKEEVKEYCKWEEIEELTSSAKISTFFIKEKAIKDLSSNKEEDFDFFNFSLSEEELEFANFERLPVSLDESLYQYNYAKFAYTNSKFKIGIKMSNLYKVTINIDNHLYIQLN